jgi:hypothetical protein
VQTTATTITLEDITRAVEILKNAKITIPVRIKMRSDYLALLVKAGAVLKADKPSQTYFTGLPVVIDDEMDIPYKYEYEVVE